MPLWTAADAADATGGSVTADWNAAGISIDTRSLEPGDLFVALKDRRDGHDFAAAALAKGASAAMVSRVPDDLPADAPLLIVDDVIRALELLAAAGRARSKAQVVGITGSVGKTSTKEMLRRILERQGKTHAAEKSFNNHWGVPVTLARLPADADFAIIEIGMSRPGEIAPLSRLARPNVAMVTTVAAAHLEAFDGLDGIAHEKAAICDGLEPGGTAVLNGDIGASGILIAAAKAAGAHVATFGVSEGATHRLASARSEGAVTVCQAEVAGARLLFKLATPGHHFAVNAVGALGAARTLGADLALACHALGGWEPPEGRGRIETFTLDPMDARMAFHLIGDAFNANPASMAAALDVLASTEFKDGNGRIAKGRRIAVLGDMLELGPDEAALHAGLAELKSLRAASLVHAVGPRMRALYKALPDSQRGIWTETAEELAERAHTLIEAGDAVMVKGSKGSRVSLVVDALRKLGHPLYSEREEGA